MTRFRRIRKARTHWACSVSLLTILSIFSIICRALLEKNARNIHFAFAPLALGTVGTRVLQAGIRDFRVSGIPLCYTANDVASHIGSFGSTGCIIAFASFTELETLIF